MKKIQSDNEYDHLMYKIDQLMAKGSENVSQEELAEIRSLALIVQEYEQSKYIVEAPTTLTGMIEMRMYELKLNQKQMAEKLNVSPAKLSLIMSGKQRADIAFLKAVHKILDVDAGFVLEHA
jgi:HTH-type transcriptional regulator/antitoxin HigA